MLDAKFGIKFNVTIDVNHLTDKFKAMYAAIHSSVEKVATSFQIDLSPQTIELIVVVIIVLFFIMLGPAIA